MKSVCVLTTTRAEYGLLYCLLKEIDRSDNLDLKLVVTGTHLSHEFGYTITDILADGFKPCAKIPVLISDDSALALTRSSSLLMLSLAEFFDREKPDCLIVLGDRLELLAACEAAMIAKVPIVHIHGGEVTEGAIDEKVRHAITKLASLHFTSTEVYRKRVIQMGEHPETVINCGALGLEFLKKEELPTKESLSKAFSFDFHSSYFLVVYHPETNKAVEDVSDLIRLLDDYPEYNKVIIYPNSDMMSKGIIRAIESYKKLHQDNVLLVKSTSRNKYLGLIKHSAMYIGNSSSGIIEVPSFFKPIINIGDRQKGRIRSESTIDVEMNYEKLKSAVEKALSDDFQKKLSTMLNPYEGECPSSLILEELKSRLLSLSVNKKFKDLEFKI